MNNYSIRMLPDNEQNFIIDNNLFDNIGKPIKLNGETYYPILYRNLYLRYYISYAGYIYDILTSEVKKFNIYDNVILMDISGGKKIYQINELLWRTFYRFPEGCCFPLDSEDGIDFSHYYEGGTLGYYVICGVIFRKIHFPKNTPEYRGFVRGGKYRLVASENGAVFDIKKKRFLMINLDNEGNPYLTSDYNYSIPLDKILLYSWYGELNLDHNTHSISNVSNVKAFVNKYSIAPDFPHINNLIISQNLSPYPSIDCIPISFIDETENDSKWLYDKLGDRYQIPIEGLSDYKITFCGAIFTKNNRVFKPYKLIYDSDNQIIDALYSFPAINKVFSMLDIYMWTFYRLNYDTILKVYSKLIMHRNLDIPVLILCNILSKELQVGGESAMIGSLLFTKLTKYPNFYISTSGALYNAKHRYFVKISNSTSSDGTISQSIPLGNDCKWFSLANTMYHNWFGRIPNQTEVVHRNNIRGDVSITNLDLNIQIPKSSYYKISFVKKLHTIISSARKKNMEIIERLIDGGIIDPQKLRMPIPEIFEK